MLTVLDRTRVWACEKKRVRHQDQTQEANPDKKQEHAYIPLTQTAIFTALHHVRMRCMRSITVGNQISQSELRR